VTQFRSGATLTEPRLFGHRGRVDARPARYAESSYEFLNRVASPYWANVRDELEDWFEVFPAHAKADLRGRFVHRSAQQHYPAWWELYLFTLFSRLGVDVEVHPDTDGHSTHPDFRCTRDGLSFYLEATTVFSGIVEEGRNVEREGWILDLVNEARNPNFFVHLAFRIVGSQRPKRDEIERPIERWLAALDPEDVEHTLRDNPDALVLPVRDWVIELNPIPIRPEARGREGHQLLGIGPMSSGWVNDVQKLRSSLERKFSHYGTLDAPLIVCVLMMSGSADRGTVEEALFGEEAIQFSGSNPEDYRVICKRNGAWVKERGPTATDISAVAVSSHLRPWTCAAQLPDVWLHPWAQVPLAYDLPFVTASASDDGSLVYADARVGGACELLGLPADWPGPEPAFY
jgi:hypothetical protein